MQFFNSALNKVILNAILYYILQHKIRNYYLFGINFVNFFSPESIVNYLKSWLVVQNLSIAFSSVFIFFEAFRLTLVKKNRQNEESRENVALYRE